MNTPCNVCGTRQAEVCPQCVNAELLEACSNLATLAETVARCSGPWTAQHRILSERYAREARAAIAKTN